MLQKNVKCSVGLSDKLYLDIFNPSMTMQAKLFAQRMQIGQKDKFRIFQMIDSVNSQNFFKAYFFFANIWPRSLTNNLALCL